MNRTVSVATVSLWAAWFFAGSILITLVFSGEWDYLVGVGVVCLYLPLACLLHARNRR